MVGKRVRKYIGLTQTESTAQRNNPEVKPQSPTESTRGCVHRQCSCYSSADNLFSKSGFLVVQRALYASGLKVREHISHVDWIRWQAIKFSIMDVYFPMAADDAIRPSHQSTQFDLRACVVAIGCKGRQVNKNKVGERYLS